MTPDIINASFELVGAIFQIKNTHQIYKDKQVKGVYWPAWIFFTAWGYWNIYYYPAFEQWWSFGAGIVMAAANTVWVSMAFYYSRRKGSLPSPVPLEF
jgi:hypothetical protein